MLKRYRASASYGSLNNHCLPYTIAITDNSKFNPEKIADIYIDRFVEKENQNRRDGGNERNRRTGEKRDNGKNQNNQARNQSCQSAECSTCGV